MCTFDIVSSMSWWSNNDQLVPIVQHMLNSRRPSQWYVEYACLKGQFTQIIQTPIFSLVVSRHADSWLCLLRFWDICLLVFCHHNPMVLKDFYSKSSTAMCLCTNKVFVTLDNPHTTLSAVITRTISLVETIHSSIFKWTNTLFKKSGCEERCALIHRNTLNTHTLQHNSDPSDCAVCKCFVINSA